MTGLKIMWVSLLVMGVSGEQHQPGKTHFSSPGFALVELFTSEGCSSCPPADEVLAAIRKDYRDNVYVLGFHVDYWDKLGWKDVYSNGDYTARQRQYARVLGLNSIYTPQVIVNGKKEFVGSDGAKLRETIEYELKNPVNRALGIRAISGKNNDGNHITVSYKLKHAAGIVLHIALIQLQAASRVSAGENRGRSLEHVNVVRDFKTISGDKEDSGFVDLKMPPGLTEKDCKVIGFLQNKNDGPIVGAVEAGLD